MRLVKAKIAGYRSIKDEIELVIDRKITVVLGANDHGKTNLLEALLHINADNPFTEDDLNWDLEGTQAAAPSLTCTFEFLPIERQELQTKIDDTVLLDALRELAFTRIAEFGEDTKNNDNSEAPSTTSAEIDVGFLNIGIEYLTLALDYTLQSLRESPQQVFDAIERDVQSYSEQQAQLDALVKKNADVKAAHEQAVATNDKVTAMKLQPTVQANEAEIKKISDRLTRDAKYLAVAQLVLRHRKDYEDWRAATELKVPKILVPETVDVSRSGLNGEAIVLCTPELNDAGFEEMVDELLPRVELIRFTKGIPDAVTSGDLSKADFEFMRGIFYYAGLERDEWPAIFEQTDRTARRLSKASEQLNRTLRKNWSQGNNLEFNLDHDSKQGQIKLSIVDPSVEARFVRASQRSTGFTNFFSLKTILHARMREADAATYIWLFDEPGVYLHPHGQNDLLQVFETLSATNQIVYCTHSLFMLNKNFPQRHRLVIKNDRGTRIDQKPYKAQWSSAITSLGLGLPGTILFANRIALVEGDSDPIYMNALLQKAVEAGWIDADINQLSFISTGESKNADALIRYLLDAAIKPKIVLIFDGDDGGKARKKNLDALLKVHSIESYTLQCTSVEECLFGLEKLFPTAVCRYAAKMSGKQTDGLIAQANESLKEAADKIVWSEWSRSTGAKLAGIQGELSSVGIAREYAQLLEDTPPEALEGKTNKSAMSLLSWLVDKLELPPTTVKEENVVTLATR